MLECDFYGRSALASFLAYSVRRVRPHATKSAPVLWAFGVRGSTRKKQLSSGKPGSSETAASSCCHCRSGQPHNEKSFRRFPVDASHRWQRLSPGVSRSHACASASSPVREDLHGRPWRTARKAPTAHS